MSAIKLKSASGSVSIEPEDAVGDTILVAPSIGGTIVATGNVVAATTLGSVVGSIEVFSSTGASIGFIPVYDSIS